MTKAPADSKKIISLATRGDLPGLQKSLAAAPDLAADPRLLNEAALHGQSAVVRLLLAAGADPDARVPSHEGYRPLARAIEHRGVPAHPGHGETIELLLAAGASLESRATWMQLVPLAVAGMAGRGETIARLQAAGAVTDLFLAAILGDASGVRRFLRSKGAATRRDENGMTVLHYAALSGLEERAPQLREIATRLLDAGADGDAREKIGPFPATPVLHFAAWKNFAVAETLLQRGCDPNAGFGNCLWKEPGPMAQLFLAHGADVNGREPSGQPFLHSRIHWNLARVVLWLLEKGADPNLTDASGHTALHEAARRGVHPRIVEALLAHGATLRARNHAGKTAWELARDKKRDRLLDLLR